MNLEIKMSDGALVEAVVTDYSAQDLATKLNNQNINMIAVGDLVLQRFSITRIMPKGAETTGNLEITMQDNVTIHADIENYSSVDLAEMLNDQSVNMIALGEVVLQRYAITRVVPKPTEVL